MSLELIEMMSPERRQEYLNKLVAELEAGWSTVSPYVWRVVTTHDAAARSQLAYDVRPSPPKPKRGTDPNRQKRQKVKHRDHHSKDVGDIGDAVVKFDRRFITQTQQPERIAVKSGMVFERRAFDPDEARARAARSL